MAAEQPSGPRRVARVLLDSPLPQLDRLFDYAVPGALTDAAVPGVRVQVPLRTAGRVVDGFIVEVDREDDADRPLSELETVVSDARVLPERLHRLARRVADRAAGSAIDVLRLAIPKRMVRAEKAWLAREDSPAPRVDPAALDRARAALAGYPELAERILAGERLAVDAPPRTVSLPGPEGAAELPAWTELLAAAAVVTLHAGRSSILAVPDRRDLDRLHAAVRSLIGDDALVRHDAGQRGPERYAGYLRTLEHVPCVVIGNRSSVYAPVHEPGLIALWDDGDPLLQEPLAPYVHCRDAALVRQELESPALVFAGHTRTTDVERLVGIGWVRECPAARRETPRVVLSSPNEGEAPAARIPSVSFRAAREAVESGPVLVQVSRPGYAPTLVCADCRSAARCGACGGPLHAPGRGATPVCRWCGRLAQAWACGRCSSTRLRLASSGSERTADELGRAFPGVRVIVADADHPVELVEAQPALVVATRGAEPLAEGGYRMVLLLDGERMLQAPDLRVGEDCLRWWSNAAALAAPGAPVHLAGVSGPAGRALATWTQPAFARAELAERAPLRMPPAQRTAQLDGAAGSVEAALAALRTDVPELGPDAVLGPVPVENAEPDSVRALVRFGYGQGRAVTGSLRARVIAEAVRGRRRTKGRPARNRLAVRVDVADPEL